MGDNANTGNAHGLPVQEGSNQGQSNGQDHHDGPPEANPMPPPGIAVPPANEANPSEERTPRTTTPTGLRDFEGRRLYFANVCSTVSPHALHCIFRSYGPIRTFHYDTALHYGYVVYLEREHALLARYGVDGLILGSRAIRVYYPPYKPRHPTRYCYNCREMGHFIQSCPYTHCNNWEYNYAQMYNQGQPVMDHMNHPSTPMMHHYPGHMIPPNPHFMYPTAPVSTIPGQPPGSATLMYQPGWPGPQTSAANMPYMQPFMSPMPTPMPSMHSPMGPMPSHMNPVVQQQMHFNHQHLIHQGQNPMQQPLMQNHTHVQQPQPVNQMPPLIPVNNGMPPQHVNPMQPMMHINNPVQTSGPSMAPLIMQPPASYPLLQQTPPPLHPNISAIIQEQAAAIIQQHITPMVQQVVSQIMQDPAINSLQQSMMQHQNIENQSGSANEEPESGSVQSGSMSMQHGSFTTMEEPRNPAGPQNILSQLMQNIPMQDSDSEYMDLGKMMHFAAQTLLQDQFGQRNEESCSRARCVHEMEEDMSPREQDEKIVPTLSCPVHNTPLTRVAKPANTTAQQSTVTKTTTVHTGSTTTPRSHQYIAETMTPVDQEFRTANTSSTDSARLNPAEQPMQSADSQYYSQYPYQPPFSLPSSIFFTLPPIVVNITSPAPFMHPNDSTGEPRATFPPPYDAETKNVPENYDFMQESERNLREFEEVVRDDDQNYAENERNLRCQHTNISAEMLGMSFYPETMSKSSVESSPRPAPPGPTGPPVLPAPSGPPAPPGPPVPSELPGPSASPRPSASHRIRGPTTPPGSPGPSASPAKSPPKAQASKRSKGNKGKEQLINYAGTSILIYEQPLEMSERDRQRQDRLKLRAMLMEENDPGNPVETDPVIIAGQVEDDIIPGEKKVTYSELISTMNSSCGEIETLFTNLSSLVGNPLAKKCLDQIRTKSEADILKLSQQLLHKIVDKDKPSDKEEILKLSNDLLMYANQKLPSTSSAEPICEGAVGGIGTGDEAVESSRSECESRKDDSDDGNYRRKGNWKKNKKRRR